MVEAFAPKSKHEALRFLKDRKCIILAGGTDLMLKRKKWPGCLPDLDSDIVFIRHLQELKNIKIDEEYISIGATCTLTEIQENILMPRYFKEVILSIASPAIRNVATIGGNICNASPTTDILPLLYALDSILIIENLGCRREIGINQFILGPGKRDLKVEELLVEIRIPINKFTSFYYKKVGTRKSTDITKASLVGFYTLEDEKLKDIRMAFGSVGPTIVRSKELENRLKGLNKGDLGNMLKDIKGEYFKIIAPIDDDESMVEYKQGLCFGLLEEFLLGICNGSEGSMHT